VKLVFHVVFANCGNLVVSSIIFNAATCFAIGKCLRRNIFEPLSLTIVGLRDLYQYHQRALVM
jgi:hypothetical protein